MLLVSAADDKIGLTSAIAASIKDERQASKISYDLSTLLKERILAIACGYEDANGLDCLRSDPALKVGCGRALRSEADLASQPTISRLENSVTKKDLLNMGIALAQQTVAQLPGNTQKVVLDIDEMEDPCHGQQEFEIFNAHYDIAAIRHRRNGPAADDVRRPTFWEIRAPRRPRRIEACGGLAPSTVS